MMKSDGYRQTEDGWYEALTPRDKARYFFNSKSFEIVANELLQSLISISDIEKPGFLRELTPGFAKALLKEMIQHTPSYMSVLQRAENIVPVLYADRAKIENHMIQILHIAEDVRVDHLYNLDE